MIELVKAFQNIATQINAILYAKAKLLGYYDVMLFLEKQERLMKYRLPGLTSTQYLGNTCYKDIESQINDLGKTEKEWLKNLEEMYRHHGAPEDLEL